MHGTCDICGSITAKERKTKMYHSCSYVVRDLINKHKGDGCFSLEPKCNYTIIMFCFVLCFYMYWAPESIRYTSFMERVLLVSGSGLQEKTKKIMVTTHHLKDVNKTINASCLCY